MNKKELQRLREKYESYKRLSNTEIVRLEILRQVIKGVKM